jgi:hypothetical protein
MEWDHQSHLSNQENLPYKKVLKSSEDEQEDIITKTHNIKYCVYIRKPVYMRKVIFLIFKSVVY